jgi:hypothetical protein
LHKSTVLYYCTGRIFLPVPLSSSVAFIFLEEKTWHQSLWYEIPLLLFTVFLTIRKCHVLLKVNIYAFNFFVLVYIFIMNTS